MTLAYLRNRLALDPGLNAHVRDAEIARGLVAVDNLSALLTSVIGRLGVKDDGLLTAADLKSVSNAIRAVPTDYQRFVKAHGDDEWGGETGYQLLQNDGDRLIFQGRNFADTIEGAIFHIGFSFSDGRFVNEVGNANKTVADVAGWLNFFLNGVNTVHGTEGADQLGSGTCSAALASAVHETFYAGLGDDITGGAGADRITLWEEAQARDTLVFRAADSGMARATIDTVEGFANRVDKIDLRAFEEMVFAGLDYTGGGMASCHHDCRYLRIDSNGDGVTDVIIAFKWVDELQASDFLFA